MWRKKKPFASNFDLGITRKTAFESKAGEKKSVATRRNARSGANPPSCNYFNPGSDKEANARFQIAGLAPVSSASSPFRPNKLEVRSANNGGG